MASIDALSGLSSKPSFDLSETEFVSLKSVREVATLDDQSWKDLVAAVHSFVGEHVTECMFTPRTLKKGPYKNLLDLFLNEGGAQFWAADREGYQRGNHFVWPADREKIGFLAFVLIRLEAAKHCAKKRKESGTDDKDNASNASSPPPPVAKKAKTTEASKKDPAAKAGSLERQRLFGGKATTNGFKDSEGRPTPEHKSSDDDMEDSIVVQEKVELQHNKKTTAGDPFTRVRDAHKLQQLDPASPSPAPRPDRKLAAKTSVKEASGLKFDVSAPAPPQVAKKPVKAAPSSKVAEGTITVKQPGRLIDETKAKGEKQKKKVDTQGKVIQDQSDLAILEQQEDGDITMSGMTVNLPDEQYQEHTGRRSSNPADIVHLFTPDANGLQATVETDHVRIKSDLHDDATIAVSALHDRASSSPADPASVLVAKPKEAVKKQSKLQTLVASQEHPGGIHPKPAGFEIAGVKRGSVHAEETFSGINASPVEEDKERDEFMAGPRKLSSSTRTLTPGASLSHTSAIDESSNTVAATTTATNAASPSPKSHVFIITIPQVQDADTETESICMTFSPTTTNWASFYCALAMQLAVEDRVAFAMGKTCKIRVPRQGQRKSRVFGFEIKPDAADTIWANVMRMVAGLADESEPVEVEFFF